MKYLTLLKANIKSQKGSFIGISLLMFIIYRHLLSVLAKISSKDKRPVSDDVSVSNNMFRDIWSYCY